MNSLKKSIASLLSVLMIVASTPITLAQGEADGLFILDPSNPNLPVLEDEEIYQWSVGNSDYTLIKRSFILWNQKAEDTLPLPKMDPIPASVNGNTFVISGQTLPNAEVTAIGGPFDLPPVMSDDAGRFEIEVALLQDQVNQYLVKIVKDQEFAPALTIFIVESSDALSAEEAEAQREADLEAERKARLEALRERRQQQQENQAQQEEERQENVEAPTKVSGPAIRARFNDVAQEDWFHAPVIRLRDLSILSGYENGNFGPGDSVTRGQLMKIALNAAGFNLPEFTRGDFSDVDRSNPFFRHIQTARRHGIVSGYSDGRFGVNDPVTRAQAAKIIMNAFGFTPVAPSEPTFPDVGPNDWFFTPVETLYANGVVKGNPDGTFKPGSIMNRAEAAVMINNAGTKSNAGIKAGFKPERLSDEQWERINQFDAIEGGDRVALANFVGGQEACPYSEGTLFYLAAANNNLDAILGNVELAEDDIDNGRLIASRIENSIGSLKEKDCNPGNFAGMVGDISDLVSLLLISEVIDEQHKESLEETSELLKELAENTKVEVEGEKEDWGEALDEINEEVDELLEQTVTIKTDCEEYKRKAAALKALQDKAAARQKKASELKSKAEEQAKKAAEAEKSASDALDQAKEDKENADKNIEKAKDRLEDLTSAMEKALSDKTGGGVKKGKFGSAPAGWQVSIGKNMGSFPLFAGEGLHIRDEAALEEFFKITKAFEKDIKAAKEAYNEAKEKKENADKNIADAEANLTAAKAANEAAKAALKAACKQLEEADAAIAGLNAAITNLNNAYRECAKLVHELKLQKRKADNAQNNAENAIGRAEKAQGFGGGDRSQSDDTIEEAEDALEESKRLEGQEDFEGAKEKADEAARLAHRAKQEVAAENCIKKCKDELDALKKSLAKEKAKTENKGVDFSETESYLRDIASAIREAERKLKAGDPEGARKACAKARRLKGKARGQISRDVQSYVDEQTEDLEKNAAQACYEFEKKKIEDNEILELLQQYQETIEAIVNALGETEKGAALLEELFELAKKAGIKIKDGEKAVDTLKRIQKALKAAQEEGGKVNDQMKELNDFLNNTFYDYLKDKLKDTMLDLAKKLAEKGFGISGGPLTAMVALWGEAWDLGDAIGNHIANQITEIMQNIFETEVKVLNLCEPANTTRQGTGHRLPIKTAWYVEVVDLAGNEIEGAEAEVTATQSSNELSSATVESGEKSEGDIKLIHHIPTGAKVGSVKCPDGSSATVIKKIVTVKRHCASDHIRVDIHVRLIVECK